MRFLACLFAMTGAAAAATEFQCMSHRECFTETNCRPHFITSQVNVDVAQNEIHFGAPPESEHGSDPLVFALHPGTEKTRYMGIKVGPPPIGVSTFTVFNTSEFVLSSAVQIASPRPDFAVGIVIRGRCELETS